MRSNNSGDLTGLAARIPRVRRAHPDEAEDLTRLARRSKAHWGYSPEFLDAAMPDLRIETEQVGAGRVFVIERADALIGFCAIQSFEQSPDRVSLSHCFVDPEFLGQNYGRLLWNYALRELRRNYPRVRRLFVVSDPNAVGFYLKCGARADGYEASIVDAKRLLPRLVYEIPSKSTRH
ncbi:MAG: GNAT family N-acetyltransferase [bacterium]|nr:GNAT family N-acetyltransferase [bacterium]